MSNPFLRASLRALQAFAGSELAERYGLHEPAREWLARGTRAGAELLRGRRKKGAREPRGGVEEGGAREPGFDLRPTEAQELIRGTLRRFAEETLRPAAAAADEALAPPPAVLEEAEELGLTLLAVPEAEGGVAEERSPMTQALIAEELARGDMGLALALLAPVGVAHLLVDQASAAQRASWLPRLLEGEVASFALLEPGPLFDPRAPRAVADAVTHGGAGAVAEPAPGGGYRLRGEKALVARGSAASFFVVSASVRGRGEKGPALFLLERGRPGVELTPDPSMGLRAADLSTLRLEDVVVPRSHRLEGEERDHQRAVDLARLAWGALAVGQGQAVLEYVKGYCNDRIAFGEPITHRQAVAFLIADLAIELEGLRLMLWRGASRAERGEAFTREAHLLRVQLSEKAMKIGSDGVQLLGGAGYIKEHPVERWYRHLRAVALMEGGLSL